MLDICFILILNTTEYIVMSIICTKIFRTVQFEMAIKQ